MKKSPYIFGRSALRRERGRLRLIERTFDPASRRRLKAAGVRRGTRCLEVGPGNGSLARWLARTAGPGRVTAVEIDPRFLGTPRGYALIKGDVRRAPLPPEAFDVVHARYVLLHIPDFRTALENIVRALKPGGRIVLEEPDFTSARPVNGTEREKASVRRVNRAVLAMFRAKGIDPAFGAALPSVLRRMGLEKVRAERDAAISRGGKGVAEVVARSAETLAKRYAATGEASMEDVKTYIAYCRNRARRAAHYVTVGATARKPGG